jgi:transposase-like protein
MELKEKLTNYITQYDKNGYTKKELIEDILILFNVSIFVCPDCKGDNMQESNKREVWCNDCKKNFKENEC